MGELVTECVQYTLEGVAKCAQAMTAVFIFNRRCGGLPFSHCENNCPECSSPPCIATAVRYIAIASIAGLAVWRPPVASRRRHRHRQSQPRLESGIAGWPDSGQGKSDSSRPYIPSSLTIRTYVHIYIHMYYHKSARVIKLHLLSLCHLYPCFSSTALLFAATPASW